MSWTEDAANPRVAGRSSALSAFMMCFPALCASDLQHPVAAQSSVRAPHDVVMWKPAVRTNDAGGREQFVGFQPRSSSILLSWSAPRPLCVRAAVGQAGSRTRPDECCFACIVCTPGRIHKATLETHVLQFWASKCSQEQPQLVARAARAPGVHEMIRMAPSEQSIR